MRIRKNAKVSPVLMTYSSSSSPSTPVPAALLQSHVCQLNQSPWDVIRFAQYCRLSEAEHKYYSCLTGYGSFGEYSNIGAVDSVASMMDIGEDNKVGSTIMVGNKGENNVIIVADDDDRDLQRKKKNSNKNDNRKRAAKALNDCGLARSLGNYNNNSNNNQVMGMCQKNDGKGWQCKREAKEGYNFCEHHLSLFRSYNNSNTTPNTNNNNNTSVNDTTSKAVPAPASLRRTRAAAKKPAASNGNPYEYYYYSGFGPLWGRRRGERGDHGGGGGGGSQPEVKAAVENSNNSSGPSSTTTTTTSKMDVDRGLDYVEVEDEVEDEDEDEDGDGDVVSGESGKKRMRKPVKARSLKSLM